MGIMLIVAMNIKLSHRTLQNKDHAREMADA
jgi:hypothetical protein